jgi:hypothetical protein
LTGPVIEAFLVDRRRDYSSGYSTRALRVLLAYLRRVGAAAAAEDSSVWGHRVPVRSCWRSSGGICWSSGG